MNLVVTEALSEQVETGTGMLRLDLVRRLVASYIVELSDPMTVTAGESAAGPSGLGECRRPRGSRAGCSPRL